MSDFHNRDGGVGGAALYKQNVEFKLIFICRDSV